MAWERPLMRCSFWQDFVKLLIRLQPKQRLTAAQVWQCVRAHRPRNFRCQRRCDTIGGPQALEHAWLKGNWQEHVAERKINSQVSHAVLSFCRYLL